MNYHAEILADSISPDGVRLTTMLTVYPRFIHSEMLRHRVFSHSVASSRAIPTEKQIKMVRETPFIPETFNMRVSGMGVGEEMDEKDRHMALMAWKVAAINAAESAETLNNIGLDKSRANRVLEPFLWVSDIISGTEWDNFYALRDHPAAQPEFQKLAKLMRDTQEASDPRELKNGQWHLPLINDTEKKNYPIPMLINVAAGRVARESYAKSQEFEPIDNSIMRAGTLTKEGHFSPFEHVARPATDEDLIWDTEYPAGEFYGNFRGWVQARKEIDNESNFAKVDA